ncbi:choice-of-anchor Q domain-containing protein [Aliisedimentitalea scapharcae]|uniref:Choice-of-anchor Q domain-containing protein n=1 Tax=Aliisedimentitalea scapharcae TaxID=1524259 RepID=A0ABZ2XUI7_9RHOB
MASFVVTTHLDTIDATDGVTSLREAVQQAETSSGADLIEFDALLAGETITLSLGQLDIAQDVTLDGGLNDVPGADITLQGSGSDRVLNIVSGAVTLTEMTVAGGHADSGGGIAISEDATVILRDSTVRDSTAVTAGGGIRNSGNLTLESSTVSGNTADLGGGGISNSGTLSLTNTTIQGNAARDGGGIYNSDVVSMFHTTITGNTATGFGGGLYTGGTYVSGRADATNTIILGNSAATGSESYGDAFAIRDGTIVSGVVSDVFQSLDANGGGALADNGGPVQTVALKETADNPAIDVGDAITGLDLDATGAPRVIDYFGVDNGGVADSGAVEAQGDFPPVEPGSLTVTTALDVVDPFDNQTSLREALAFADLDPDHSVISFASGVGEAFENDTTIVLDGTPLVSSSSITLSGDFDGDGTADLTLDGNGGYTALESSGDVVSVSAINVTGAGNGLVFNSVETLSLSNLTLYGNDNSGLRLYNCDTATVSNSEMFDNGGAGLSVFSSFGYGGATDLHVNDVVSRNNEGNGLSVHGNFGSGYYPTRATVQLTNVSSLSNGGSGVFAGQVARVYFDGSTLSGNQNGGVFTDRSAYVYLTDSTVSSNVKGGLGGGGAYNLGRLFLMNTTVADNAADGDGGGIHNRGSLTLQNSTVTGNSATQSGGGIYNLPSKTSTLTLSLVLGNSAGTDAEIAGDITQEGQNLVGGDAQQVFAAVGPDGGGVLADNGGPVQTVALNPSVTNPALDLGRQFEGVETDATGAPRAINLPDVDNGGIVDLGAYELQAVSAAPEGGVVIDGLPPVQGRTLVADISSVRDADGIVAGTEGFQWQRDGVDIDGSTGSSHVLTQEDVGSRLSVVYTFTDSLGAHETVTSAPTSAVADVNDAPVGAVVISGTAEQGGTLTADPSGVSDADGINAATLSGQWLRDGVAVAGATATTYALTQADVGAQMSYRFGYTDNAGTAETVTSAATVAVANVNDLPTGAVTISGGTKSGDTLTADTSGVADADGINESTEAGQWLRDGTPIAGATNETYTLTSDDVGRQISVVFTYTDTFGTDESVTSAATGPITPGALNLTGTPGRDVLIGAEGNDTITGLGDNDRLVGNAGNDIINGGDGADTLNGGEGNDTIQGGATDADLRDVVFAGAGDDSVDAGAGNDQVFGQEGNDTIAGGAGVDDLQGQDGDDVITGSAFSDLVFGGAGNDFVNGGFGSDRINGGSGADKFFHAGVEGHGSDWLQDYLSTEGDVLFWGGVPATAGDFQVNLAHTANDAGERSGDDTVQEAFVIYKPTEQIIWALVDGGGQSAINIQIGTDTFDLLI